MEEVSGTPRRKWKGKTKFDLENRVVRKGDNVRLKLAEDVSSDRRW